MRFGKYSRFSKWFDVKKEFDSGPESDEDSKKSSDKKKKRTGAKWEGQGDKYLSNKLESISEIDDKSQITRPNSRIGSPNVSLNDSMDLSHNEGWVFSQNLRKWDITEILVQDEDMILLYMRIGIFNELAS